MFRVVIAVVINATNVQSQGNDHAASLSVSMFTATPMLSCQACGGDTASHTSQLGTSSTEQSKEDWANGLSGE